MTCVHSIEVTVSDLDSGLPLPTDATVAESPDVRRYHVPASAPGIIAIRRRCAAVTSQVKRYAVAHGSTSDGGEFLARLRVIGHHGTAFRHTTKSNLVMEIDIGAIATAPARRLDFGLPTRPASIDQWLKVLGRAHAADVLQVHHGWWTVPGSAEGEPTARLSLEDRDHGRLLLDVELPPGTAPRWTTPPEWEGVIDVTGDPKWARPVLTRETWPVLFEAPTPAPAPARLPRDGRVNAWGVPIAAPVTPAAPALLVTAEESV